MKYFVILVTLSRVSCIIYDTFTGREVALQRRMSNSTQDLLDGLSLFYQIRPWCTIDVPECSPYEPRRVDGTCNNLRFPTRGATFTPYHRLLPPNHSTFGGLRTSTSGEPLPNARKLRVSLISDGRVHNKYYTQLVTNQLLMITGDITSAHDTINYIVVTTTCCFPGGALNPTCMPIEVPFNDIHLRESGIRCLNLTRALTYQRFGCAPISLPPERINTSPPLLDISNMYGINSIGVDQSRLKVDGLLRFEVDKGKEWPPNGAPICLANELPQETYCYNGGNPGLNAPLGIQLVGLWHFRSHNQIARILAQMNPCWGDERLFLTARDINLALYQHITYYELMPEVLGYKLLLKNQVIYETNGHVDDYDDSVEPRVSIEYVIATRWFHTLQEGRLQLFDNQGKFLNELDMTDYTLRTGALRVNNTVEGVTQGAFREPCAGNDLYVDPEIGERILGPLQRASDVSSSDIMKGRDVGLPSYNRYRELCHLPIANTFDDLYQWMPKDQVDVISRSYESVEDVDLLAGIMVERPLPGAMVGPTLACIMIDQLLRWRRSDRFWYENSIHAGSFTQEQLYEIRKMTIARLICDHGDSVDSIQPYAFVLPNYRNEITDCSNIPALNWDVWRDSSCNNNPQNSTITQLNTTQNV
ncbi:PREDICTED: peroxidase-like [Papilio polytes]|uniref:peroxidase-like n=1 Tax=Papilio polytes TaxID=76194 RepID=UPI00067650F0|nr:PREDICTED: peroxidase-like [Papilio polytes]